MGSTVEEYGLFAGPFGGGGGDGGLVGWGGDVELGYWSVVFGSEARDGQFGEEVERLVRLRGGGAGGCGGG